LFGLDLFAGLSRHFDLDALGEIPVEQDLPDPLPVSNPLAAVVADNDAEVRLGRDAVRGLLEVVLDGGRVVLDGVAAFVHRASLLLVTVQPKPDLLAGTVGLGLLPLGLLPSVLDPIQIPAEEVAQLELFGEVEDVLRLDPKLLAFSWNSRLIGG